MKYAVAALPPERSGCLTSRSEGPEARHLIWPEVCQGCSTEGPRFAGLFGGLGGGGRAGGCATRGHTDMRGLATAGPVFVSEPAV
jgi:hypothetical protein